MSIHLDMLNRLCMTRTCILEVLKKVMYAYHRQPRASQQPLHKSILFSNQYIDNKTNDDNVNSTMKILNFENFEICFITCSLLRIFFQDRTLSCNYIFVHFSINKTLHRSNSLGVAGSRWASLGVDSSRFKRVVCAIWGLFRLFWGFIEGL
jgi:hypothetical protein